MGNLAQSETVGGYRIRQRLRSQQFVLRDGYWVSPGLEPIRDALCDTQTELVDKQLRAQEARRRQVHLRTAGFLVPLLHYHGSYKVQAFYSPRRASQG